MTYRANHSAESALRPLVTGGDGSDTFRIRRGVKALVTTPRRVLLVRERHADGTPFWTLPGGGAHHGEPTDATLRRELLEELRCRCTVQGVTDSFWYVHQSLYRTVSVYTVFRCALLGNPSPAVDEICEARWFPDSELPPTTLPGVVASVERNAQ